MTIYDSPYFYENKRFLIAFRNDNVKLFGEAYIANFTTTAPLYQEIEEDIMLQGTGQLIIGTDVNPRIEKQIREAEGEKIAVRLKSELFKGGHKKLKA